MTLGHISVMACLASAVVDFLCLQISIRDLRAPNEGMQPVALVKSFSVFRLLFVQRVLEKAVLLLSCAPLDPTNRVELAVSALLVSGALGSEVLLASLHPRSHDAGNCLPNSLPPWRRGSQETQGLQEHSLLRRLLHQELLHRTLLRVLRDSSLLWRNV